MRALSPALWVLLTLAASCGSSRGSQEGPCFDPGEACGAGFCSQSAYCDPAQQCVSKLIDGSACSDPKQCTGARCDSGKCAGGPVVCRGG